MTTPRTNRDRARTFLQLAAEVRDRVDAALFEAGIVCTTDASGQVHSHLYDPEKGTPQALVNVGEVVERFLTDVQKHDPEQQLDGGAS
ncbi:hypothetical protein [Streptomyces sp. TS71-3]|uniref:hypothetical protein n=1 Tax=Streptomyces sp. TS71-3 TaxID=2733862 RepID=UPI001B067E13|nr:hypothetical protein [Streptomyces sp. TS71-3]GHJ34473.1 hypothetical protein Sm713_00820 [Streptomyces sp. TS71-3]